MNTSNANHTEDPVVEGLRGVAALMVVVTHFSQFLTREPGAWAFTSTGVDLFFVLSGYVFAPYFFNRPFKYASHLVRRFFRLYPLYLLSLVVYVALKPPDLALSHVWSHVFMMHTLHSLDIAFFYNPAYWSLPPEIEFYLLLPALILFKQRFGLALLLTVSLCVKIILVAGASPLETGVTSRALATVHLPGLLVEFLLGVLAFYLVKTRRLRHRMVMLPAGVCCLMVALALFAKYLTGPPHIPGTTGFWIGGFIGLMAAFAYMFILAGMADREIRAAPLQVICRVGGQISFGAYLFHNAVPAALQPLLQSHALPSSGWLALMIYFFCTMVLAWTLHHLLEAPARQWGRHLSRRFFA